MIPSLGSLVFGYEIREEGLKGRAGFRKSPGGLLHGTGLDSLVDEGHPFVELA